MLNTLDRKIRQMHAALAGLSTDDLSIIQPQIKSENGYFYIKVDFNENSDSTDLYNKATLLIHNIASIKDHLKAWCKKQNVQFKGDELINSSKAVALVHDLWNIDKHAELDRPPRSGYKPELKDLKTVLSISSGLNSDSGALISINPCTGEITTGTHGSGAVQLSLDAQIVDEKGNSLGDFLQTCTQAVEAWSSALVAAGIS